jgi:hypothetical protein
LRVGWNDPGRVAAIGDRAHGYAAALCRIDCVLQPGPVAP